jgi:hypothetical protein
MAGNWCPLNQAFDALLPKGLQGYWKTVFLTDLNDGAINTHLQYGSKVPTVETAMHIHPIDGAVQRVAVTDTAFPRRTVKFTPVIAGMWRDPADNEANIAWVRDFAAALRPYSAPGGYINFMDGDDQPGAAASYGQNYQRLREIKAKYDPQNLFHVTQNITPALGGRRQVPSAPASERRRETP